jgi:hypothetical protein
MQTKHPQLAGHAGRQVIADVTIQVCNLSCNPAKQGVDEKPQFVFGFRSSHKFFSGNLSVHPTVLPESAQ